MRGIRVNPAPWTCVDCGASGVALMTGVVPVRCDECKRAHRAKLSREARARNPEAAARYQRDYRLKRYGVGPLEYELMVERAGGACEACGARGELHVDHCHTTRRGRGMLCPPCNKALGLVRDDPARLRALADYLER